MSTIKVITDSDKIDGILVIYSDQYSGNAEYRQLVINSLEKGPEFNRGVSVTYKSALIQLLETIYESPIPIVGGMNGDIGPDSFGLSMAFDLRISSDRSVFFNQNLQIGLPPSPLLSYFLVQSLGSPLATQLTFTRSKLSRRRSA